MPASAAVLISLMPTVYPADRSSHCRRNNAGMDVLPDILAPGVEVVFCGTAVGGCPARRGHYHAGPGDAFWQLLHDAGFTDRRLTPEDDASLPELGLGLTDLVRSGGRGL